MNVSYRWLRAVAPELDLSPEELAAKLADRGAPVEGIVRSGGGLEEIVVGRVEEVSEHPEADRLVLCRVHDGKETVQVVCGAPNARAGGLYPFARPGTVLPGGMEIREAEIRGRSSRGMLCSEKELELGEDASGLLELPEDLSPGQPLVEALGLNDVLLDVEVTPNRGDLLSHVGVAREVAPGGVSGIRLPEIPDAPDASFDLRRVEAEGREGGVTIRIEAPDLCRRYLGAVIRGVEVGPSPEWLQARLRSVGARPINNVVDATNYVLRELGQPLHAFDLAELADATVVVRRARSGETIRTLDGEIRKLGSEMLAICDARTPVAIAGVMGGEASEVTGETTDVLLECALFDPAATRATRRDLGMSTDASYRFERGVDPTGLERALRRCVELIVAGAGGDVDPVALDVCPRPWRELRVSLRPGRVEHLLGVELPPDEIARLLQPLGFQVESGEEGVLSVDVPGWRSYDVRREVDLIEEVARTYGYGSLPEEMGAFRPTTVPDDPLFRLQDELRDLLTARGFLEAQTPAFCRPEEGEVEVRNPVSSEEGFLRSSLLPALLRRVEHNFARGVRDVRLFESGTVFFATPAGEPPREETRLAVVLTGRRHPPHWSARDEAADLWDLKGLLTEVAGLALPEAALGDRAPEGGALDPGLAFSVTNGQGEVVGAGGRVVPGRVDAPAWAGEIWALELTLPEAPAPRPHARYRRLPSFPPVERDLAIVVPDDLASERVVREARNVGGEYLEEISVFDLYRGEGVPPETRSIAYRLRFRAPDRTLEDGEVDQAVSRIVDHLEEELGVEPRGR